jgi:hypothetical protein
MDKLVMKSKQLREVIMCWKFASTCHQNQAKQDLTIHDTVIQPIPPLCKGRVTIPADRCTHKFLDAKAMLPLSP